MVNVRSANEIILSLIDFFRLAQPDLDTKPGTVARDLFVDSMASQLSILYDELSGVSDKQSLRLVTGSDLDKLAKNFGLVRKQSSPSTGVALMTFASIPATININQGDIVTANSGLSFTVQVGVSVVPNATNFYRSVATQFASQLAFVGITDQYAVEVTVTASSPGSQGNIGPYSLNSATTPGVSNVTNINTFQGGTDQETDTAFRNRVLSAFNGASVGTTLGYLNVALSTTGTLDAAVVGPGNPLMTRDGTLTTLVNGVPIIVSEGVGGKVDIYVLGSILTQNSDSFIYLDKSNDNDPASPANNWVLGQLPSNANMTVAQKRVTDIAAGTLPFQPVPNLISVTGSQSGSNFVQQTTDNNGVSTGNYKLILDTGAYAGSPFGFDTFAWTDDRIRDFQDGLVKGQVSGQDATSFTGVTQIHDVQQNLSITNENSMVTMDRSIIQLIHTPATNVTRVFNVNTGERYIITNQNLDATTPFNNTGRIQISGNTLPSPSDVLQVDYTWVVDFDQYTDFDGLVSTQNIRPVTDSVDWGYASDVANEIVAFTTSPGSNSFSGNTSQPIATIISADTFVQVDGYVQQVTSGNFVNRLEVVISYLAVPTNTVDSVTWKNSNSELYNTAQSNGTFSNTAQVVGINILYVTSIILPTDTPAISGDNVTVYLNSTNVFQSGTSQGSSSGTQVTIPSSLINTAATSINLRVSYITNISDLFSSAVTPTPINLALPASRIGNGYILSNNNGFNNFSIVNISRRENQIVQQNLSNQFFVELNLPVANYGLLASDVLTVLRLSDGLELWNQDNLGQVINGQDGNYQLILDGYIDGYNIPVVGDRVLVIYYATDTNRFQPFTWDNEIIKTRLDTLLFDQQVNGFVIPLVEFTAQASGLSFEVLDVNDNISYFNVSDGYLTLNGVNQANISSFSTNFDTLPDLTNKRVKITGAMARNNDGYFDIIGYNANNNEITITNILSKITVDQISIIQVIDGQEIWNYSGTIDVPNNRIIIPNTPNTATGNLVYVMFFNFQNIRRAPTRLIATTQDQTVNPGSIAITGNTLGIVRDVVFTSTSTGLTINLQEALQTALDLSSAVSIPTNIQVVKVIAMSKVVTVSQTNDEVLETLVTYDVQNTAIANNLFYPSQMLQDTFLSNLECILPSTINNTLTGASNNLPTLGDSLMVTFYYTTIGNSENVTYTKNGTLYTNNRFMLINKMYVSSGFTASQATRFTTTSYTQPTLGAKYNAFYDYLAPKQNERIVINYDYNQLVGNVTFNVETARPINADVLVKQGLEVLLDLTMNVVISSTFLNSSTTVLQNVRSALLTALTTTEFGQTVDQITLINIAQGIPGIARARILYFNSTGSLGSVLSITAQANQYFNPNNLIINTESL
jgi:phage-related baseplate assembly protein